MTRPEITIDWKKVDSLLISGSPGTEVAGELGIHPDTLYLRCQKDNNMGFSDYLAQKRSKGDALLRRRQFEKALGLTKEGDTTLLIWLGKQRLGQRENEEKPVTIDENALEAYNALMNQIKNAQSTSNTETNKVSSEQ